MANRNIVKLTNGTQDMPNNCYQATNEKEAARIVEWLTDNDIPATQHDLMELANNPQTV